MLYYDKHVMGQIYYTLYMDNLALSNDVCKFFRRTESEEMWSIRIGQEHHNLPLKFFEIVIMWSFTVIPLGSNQLIQYYFELAQAKRGHIAFLT